MISPVSTLDVTINDYELRYLPIPYLESLSYPAYGQVAV